MTSLQVRETLIRQVGDAVGSLQGRRVTAAEIHAARKSLKKARATLRLLRPALAETTYRRENNALRDAARPLSTARDAEILVDSLDRLEKLYGPAAKESIPTSFRRSLARDQRKARPSANPSLSKPLVAAQKRLARLRTSGEDWTVLGKGLQHVYARGRKAMKQALRTPTPECFHEWRKQTKYLWHELQVLEPLWPGPIGELADQLHQLSDYLGDDHDLAVLRTRALERPKCFHEPGGAGALLALIDRCQTRLREKAMRAGERIYVEKPAEFSARFGGYWKQWAATQR